jgi:FlaA1/EpsC-like NDP-sugar epimerase
MTLERLFELQPKSKLSVLIICDFSSLVLALGLSFILVHGLNFLQSIAPNFLLLAWYLVFTLLLLFKSGHYHQMVRYISSKAIYSAIIVLGVSSILFFVLATVLGSMMANVLFMLNFLLASLFIILPRFIVQAWAKSKTYTLREKCLVFGASEAGRTLVQTLKMGNELLPIAFIDDKHQYMGKRILGLPVSSLTDITNYIKVYGVTKILLAVNNTSSARLKELILELASFPIELLMVPNIQEVASGKRKISDLREIRIEELLGREPVQPITQLMDLNILGKRVLVTGAGGSIGSELSRQIAMAKPATLVLLDFSEFNLYQIHNELKTSHPDLELIVVLSNIQDTKVLRATMEKEKIQTIYHTAAYKHVPMVEANPMTGVRNNVFGTANVALAAVEYNVEKFVFISTDKAVRPTNIMGATKRFAELYIQAIAELASGTEFSIVRFGNVLGSSGSVVPLFTKQIQMGGPVTVTHPDITRYFMTIPEAAQLVIQAGAMGKAGDVYVLDMGPAIKIVDLAAKMAMLMGCSLKTADNPQGDIQLEFSGLRPGEKLFEELLIEEGDNATQHPRILGASETKVPFDEVVILFDRLNGLLLDMNEEGVKRLLREAPLAYKPALH